MTARQMFFGRQVHMSAWKDSMSGKNELRCIEMLESLGYKLGIDYVRQHPLAEKFVLDFAFVKEQVAIEVDGKNHNTSIQRMKDDKRDRFLTLYEWVPLRFKEEWMFGTRASFCRSLIREVVNERRAQWEAGALSAIDVPRFKDEDYPQHDFDAFHGVSPCVL